MLVSPILVSTSSKRPVEQVLLNVTQEWSPRALLEETESLTIASSMPILYLLVKLTLLPAIFDKSFQLLTIVWVLENMIELF